MKHKKNATKKVSKWHRLDNMATAFPLITRKNFSNVYRVAVELNLPVQPDILQAALDLTLPTFTNFTFRIRKGVFWNYFEHTKSRLLVGEEMGRPCSYLESAENGDYLFKVFYFNRKITLEVFHSIADATGAINFLKALTRNYLGLVEGRETYGFDSSLSQDNPDEIDTLDEIENTYVIENTFGIQDTYEIEDTYLKNYVPHPNKGKGTKSGMALFRIANPEEKLERAWRLRGEYLPVSTMGIIQGFFDLSKALEIVKRQGVTLTVYLVSVYIWSIHKTRDHFVDSEEKLAQSLNKPIQVAIPVNLRKYFESETNMNFFSHITISVDNKLLSEGFDALLQNVQGQFEGKVTKDNLTFKIARNIELQRKIVMKVMPLPVKTLLMRILHVFSVQSYTSTVSNVGLVDVDSSWAGSIRFFEMLLNSTTLDPIKLSLCSYENTLVASFSSQLKSTIIQRVFFEHLRDAGFNFYIASNGVYYERM